MTESAANGNAVEKQIRQRVRAIQHHHKVVTYRSQIVAWLSGVLWLGSYLKPWNRHHVLFALFYWLIQSVFPSHLTSFLQKQDVWKVVSKQLGGTGGSGGNGCSAGILVPEGQLPKHKHWPSPTYSPVNVHWHTRAEEHQTDRSLHRVPWCLLEPVDSNHTWTCAWWPWPPALPAGRQTPIWPCIVVC